MGQALERKSFVQGLYKDRKKKSLPLRVSEEYLHAERLFQGWGKKQKKIGLGGEYVVRFIEKSYSEANSWALKRGEGNACVGGHWAGGGGKILSKR